MAREPRENREDSEFTDKLVHINRVAKVVKGGRRFGFAALVVVGDAKSVVVLGRVGRRAHARTYNELLAGADVDRLGGTSTAGIPRSRARALACSGPAPPKATSTNCRGS